MADREGRLEYRPTRIKARILPYDQCDISNLLCALEETKFISRYEANGEVYIQIENFAKHQRPHTSKTRSVIPSAETVQKSNRTVKKKRRTADFVEPRARARRGKGMEGNGEERNGEEGRGVREVGTPTKGDAAPSDSPLSQFFSEAYLDGLQADPANAQVEVRYVAAEKMIRWCINHGKEINNDRLLSWLHREYPNRKGNGSVMTTEAQAPRLEGLPQVLSAIISAARRRAGVAALSDAALADEIRDWQRIFAPIPTDRLEECELHAIRTRSVKALLQPQELLVSLERDSRGGAIEATSGDCGGTKMARVRTATRDGRRTHIAQLPGMRTQRRGHVRVKLRKLRFDHLSR